MRLIDIETGRTLIGIIEELNWEGLTELDKNDNFQFDWTKETKYNVFQIQVKGEKETLGVISLIDVPQEFRVHINLIESSSKHRGKEKKIDNISGCLISYACQLAFEKGYDGFVSLVPKTRLVNYYHKKFGFIQVGTQMAIFDEKSQLIILKYQTNEIL
ncbi:MAG: hypothetical protein ACPGVB_09725 [Chitinophagales bacterium]